MKSTAVTLVMITAFLVGCSSVDVTTDYDREADFTRYKSFDWMERNNPRDGGPSIVTSPLNMRRLRTAIERELSAKGLQQTPDSPDVYVAIHVGARDRIDVERFGYRYGRWGRAWGTYTKVDRYKEGSFVVDVIDARTRDLVWRGIAKADIRRGDMPEDIVNDAMKELFKEYPPHAN